MINHKKNKKRQCSGFSGAECFAHVGGTVTIVMTERLKIRGGENGYQKKETSHWD